MDSLPVYSIDLVKKLDELYPDKLPPIEVTDRELGVLIGRREVVNFLLNRIKQNTEELPKVLNKD